MAPTSMFSSSCFSFGVQDETGQMMALALLLQVPFPREFPDFDGLFAPKKLDEFVWGFHSQFGKGNRPTHQPLIDLQGRAVRV